MTKLHLCSWTTLALLTSACSVYSNASRKYLDKSAYDLAGIKVRESLLGCAEPVADPSWTDATPVTATDATPVTATDATPDDATDLSTKSAAPARVQTRDFAGGYELRVSPRRDFACDFRFPSAASRVELTDAAVTHARDQSSEP